MCEVDAARPLPAEGRPRSLSAPGTPSSPPIPEAMRAAAALCDADLRLAVGDIEVPSLILGGAQDLATPPAESHWLHEHILVSELVLIEGAAHISNLERPEVFGDALERHLERN